MFFPDCPVRTPWKGEGLGRTDQCLAKGPCVCVCSGPLALFFFPSSSCASSSLSSCLSSSSFSCPSSLTRSRHSIRQCLGTPTRTTGQKNTATWSESEFPFLDRLTVLLNSGGSNSPWFWVLSPTCDSAFLVGYLFFSEFWLFSPEKNTLGEFTKPPRVCDILRFSWILLVFPGKTVKKTSL